MLSSSKVKKTKFTFSKMIYMCFFVFLIGVEQEPDTQAKMILLKNVPAGSSNHQW